MKKKVEMQSAKSELILCQTEEGREVERTYALIDNLGTVSMNAVKLGDLAA